MSIRVHGDHRSTYPLKVHQPRQSLGTVKIDRNVKHAVKAQTLDEIKMSHEMEISNKV